jgi:hypothetical protein
MAGSSLRFAAAATGLLVGVAWLVVFDACGNASFESQTPSDAGDASTDANGDDGAPPPSDAGSPGICANFDAASFALVASGTAVCPPDPSPTDLSIDQLNCGRCGHDCLGGACTNGACQPVTIYQEPNEGGVPAPGGAVFAVANGNIYWVYPDPASGTLVLKYMPLVGSMSPTTITSAAVAPLVAAVDGTTVYYVDGPDLHRVDSTGDQLIETTTSFVNPTSIAIDSTSLYVTTLNSGVVQVAKSDGGLTTLGTASADVQPGTIVVDAPWVEWIDSPWLVSADAGSSLGRRRGGAVVAATPLGHASGLANDARRNLYWYDELGHHLFQLAEDDPSAVPAALGSLEIDPDAGNLPFAVQGVLVDNTRVFVGLPDPTDHIAITEFSICGPAPRVLFGSFEAAGSIFQDDKAIYWTEYFGAIRRLAK